MNCQMSPSSSVNCTHILFFDSTRVEYERGCSRGFLCNVITSTATLVSVVSGGITSVHHCIPSPLKRYTTSLLFDITHVYLNVTPSHYTLISHPPSTTLTDITKAMPHYTTTQDLYIKPTISITLQYTHPFFKYHAIPTTLPANLLSSTLPL